MKIFKYRKYIKELFATAWRKVKSVLDQVRVLLLLPDRVLDSVNSAIYMTYGDLRLDCPLDKALMQTHFHMMIAAGWERSRNDLLSTSWYPSQKFKKAIGKKSAYKTQVEFMYFEHTEGATCVRNIIGTEMVENSIYEVVCKEGAAEGAI